MIIAYILFYVFALFIEESKPKTKYQVLMITCVMLALMAGFRDVTRWSDTMAYVTSFSDYTNSLWNWTSKDSPYGYSEYGFYFLGVIFKTFSNSVTGYLLFIAGLTFVFLYKDFKRYCYYPILGVCAYVSRFYLARNFIQIRAGLSYAVVLWAVQYITKRDWKRYFFWVFIAVLFHSSSLLAVPLYFLCLVKIKKWHIVVGIIIAFILGGVFTEPIRLLVSNYATDMNVTTYVTKNYQREQGLLNPMIYFQLIVLFVYTFNERILKWTSPDYYTIRTAYFYSTFILISLSMYTALSGRTSSMFSTLEMAIIPTMINTFVKKNRMVAYIGLGVALTIIFSMYVQ